MSLASVLHLRRGTARSKIMCQAGSSGPLTSLLQPDRGYTAQTGWFAVPRTRVALRRFAIGVPNSLPCQYQWTKALREQSLEGIPTNGTHEKPIAFNVLLSDGNTKYIIRDARIQEVVNNLPDLPVTEDQELDANNVGDVLEHLARFSLVKELVHHGGAGSNLRFPQSFTAQITSRLGTVISNPEEQIVEVVHSERALTFELEVESISDKVLYVHVLNMSPMWKVEGIDCGTREVIPPGSEEDGFSGFINKCEP